MTPKFKPMPRDYLIYSLGCIAHYRFCNSIYDKTIKNKALIGRTGGRVIGKPAVFSGAYGITKEVITNEPEHYVDTEREFNYSRLVTVWNALKMIPQAQSVIDNWAIEKTQFAAFDPALFNDKMLSRGATKQVTDPSTQYGFTDGPYIATEDKSGDEVHQLSCMYYLVIEFNDPQYIKLTKSDVDDLNNALAGIEHQCIVAEQVNKFLNEYCDFVNVIRLKIPVDHLLQIYDRTNYMYSRPCRNAFRRD